QPAPRRRIAYYIAHLHGGGRLRRHVQQIAVTEEGQHAVAARAHAQRVAGSQEALGQVLEGAGRAQGAISSKRRRAMGASSSSRNTSAHHSPKRPASVIEVPATGSRVTTGTAWRSPVKDAAKCW